MKISKKHKIDWITGLQNNTDPYGSAVYRYAETWANLMEVKMEQGMKIEQIAEDCSDEADTEGITGFMYGCAVQILSNCWEHGEELRRWHKRHKRS